MRDEVPDRNGVTANSHGAPKPSRDRALVGPSPDHAAPPADQFSKTIRVLMDASGSPLDASTSDDDVASNEIPSTDDALEAAGNIAEAQRRFFDLRRALKSAVRVLTKERSFLQTGPTSPDDLANRVIDQATQPEEEEPQAERPIGLGGHTSTVAMPEVLGFLAQLRKSGTLWIWNELDHFRVKLVDGNVTFARSESRRQGSLLGEILVEQGAVDAAQFEQFMEQERPSGHLGDALLEAGLVTRQALTVAIQHQAQCVFNCAYALEDAYFRFDASDEHEAVEGIRISVTQMLFESARARDESEQRRAIILANPLEE